MSSTEQHIADLERRVTGLAERVERVLLTADACMTPDAARDPGGVCVTAAGPVNLARELRAASPMQPRRGNPPSCPSRAGRGPARSHSYR